MIYIIDDDRIMAECIARAAGAVLREDGDVNGETRIETEKDVALEKNGQEDGRAEIRIFSNGIEAMAALDMGVPRMIFLDILLDGPDGFSFLNELMSYSDTEKIPVVIVSTLDLGGQKLEDYGVVGVLNKSKMLPEQIMEYVRKYGRE